MMPNRSAAAVFIGLVFLLLSASSAIAEPNDRFEVKLGHLEVSGPGDVNNGALTILFAHSKDRLHTCVERGFGEDDPADRTINIRFGLSKSGDVTAVESVDQTVGSDVPACIKQVLNGWHIKDFEGGPATVDITLKIDAPDANDALGATNDKSATKHAFAGPSPDQPQTEMSLGTSTAVSSRRRHRSLRAGTIQ